ncbi:hypothetical protein [Massilia aerilata]|uniref:Lipoprotein n=1 Tax=Massilia aerilata TaxID=453817 RepID=A0ABW0RSI6_9BURK
MLLRNVSILPLIASLAACAGTAPSSLTRLDDGRSIKLSDSLVYEVNKGILGTKYEYTFVPGTYRAAFSDLNGAYFQGPPSCFRAKLMVAGGLQDSLVGKTVVVADCGVYVPADPSKLPSLYTVNGTGANMTLGAKDDDISRALTTNQIIANPSISPAAGGLAGGIVGGLSAAISAAEQGRLVMTDQPPTAQLKLLVSGH